MSLSLLLSQPTRNLVWKKSYPISDQKNHFPSPFQTFHKGRNYVKAFLTKVYAIYNHYGGKTYMYL